MQKKYIIPVLMAVPTAMPMMADIVLPDNSPVLENWAGNGVNGEKPIINSADKSVESVYGISQVSQTLQGLPKGSYSLKFEASNNITVEVKIGETALTVANEDGGYAFSVAEKSNVTLIIKATAANEVFSFKAAALWLDFDFEAAAAALNGQLAAVGEIVAPKNGEDTALKAKYDTLVKAKEEIEKNITSLATPTLEIYDNFKFYLDTDGYTSDEISIAISELKKDVEAYTPEVNAANDAYDIADYNQKVIDDLNKRAANLDKELTKCENAMGTSGYAYEQNKDAVAEYKQGIADYRKTVEELAAKYKELDTKIPEEGEGGWKEIGAIASGWKNQYDQVIKDGLWQESQQILDKINADKADAAAYAEYEAKVAELEKIYTAAITSIDKLSGVTGLENNFSANQAEKRQEILNIKDTAIAECSIKKDIIAGAAANKEAALNELSKAIEDINKVVTDLTAEVDALNAEYKAEMGVINGTEVDGEKVDGLTQKLDKAHQIDGKDIVVPDTFKPMLEGEIKAIEDAIAALTGEVTDGYKAQNLPVENFDDKVSKIESMINELQSKCSEGGFYATVGEVSTLLAETWETINEDNKETDDKTYPERYKFIIEKFQSTYDNLLASVNALTLDGVSEEAFKQQVDALKEAITAFGVNAKQLHDAVTTYYDGLITAESAIANLDKALGGKFINLEGKFDIAAFIASLDKEGGIKDQLATIKAAYEKALEADNQECWKAVQEASALFADYDFEAKAIEVEKQFRKDLTTSNWNVLDAKAKNLPTDVDLTKVNGLIADAETAKNNAFNAADFDAKNFQDADEAIQAAYLEVGKVIESDNAYHTDFATQLETLESSLASLREHNAEVNNDVDKKPAFDYYAEDVIGLATDPAKGSMQARYNDLLAKVEAAHQNSTLADTPEGSEVTNAVTYKTELTALTNLATYVYTAIVQNEMAHTMELNANQRVMGVIEDALATIAKYKEDFTDADFTKTAEEWEATINQILNEELVAVNRDVAQAYGAGLSFASNPFVQSPVGDNLIVFDKRYDEIEAKVLALTAEYAEEYGDAVVAFNNAFIAKDSAWSEKVKELRGEYTSSIESYNKFLTLQNEKYKNYIAPILETHKDIYDYSSLTRNLEQSVNDFVADANKALEPIDETKFNLISIRRADNYIDEMKGKVEALSKAVNDAAKKYYAIIEPEAANAINDAEAAMRAAKIDEAIIENALTKANYDYYYPAVDLYAATTKEDLTAPTVTVTETIGYVMDQIANYLDKVAGAIDIQAAAQADWTAVYGKSLETFKECEEILASCNAVTAEEIAEVQAAIDEAKQNAAALDTTAKADEDLISNLLGYKGDLSQILADIRTKVDDLKSASDANVAEQEAWDNYNNDVIPTLKSDYDAFLAFINMMACESSVDTQSIADAIAAVEKAVKDNKGNLVKNAATIKAAIDNAKDELKNGYETAAAKEKAILEKQVEAVKVAFNNAKVSPNCPSDIENINVELDKLFEDIKNLTFDINDNKTIFKDSALGFEQQLNTWLVYLERFDPDHGNTLQATLETLNKLVEDQAAAIAEGKAGVNDLVKETYDSKYDDLAAELDAVKAAIIAVGNNVITQAGNFEAAINAIGDKLAELNAEAKAAGDKAEADKAKQDLNDANYTDLTQLIDSLNSQLEDLKAAIENYGYSDDTYYQNRITVITNTIADLKQEIDDQNDAVGLDAAETTNLKDQAVTIADNMTEMAVNMATRYTNVAQYAAFQAIQDALHALNLDPKDGKFVVPAILQTATQALDELNDQYTATSVDYSNWCQEWANRADAVASELDPMADAFKEIAEAAASVKATAEENTFRYGDVNEDNEVDVLDVQQVLTWVMSLQAIDELDQRIGAAADVNQDGQLNIADVTAIINMAMGENESQVRFAMGRRMVESNNTIYPELVSAENGVRRFAISLANSEVFANGQFDLKLAPGMMLESVTIGERVKGHEVLSQDHGDITRVAVVSMENAAIQGTDGAVVYVEVSGEGNIAIENAVFATPKAVGHVISNGETSAIDKVIEGARDLKERIYNAAGQQLDRVQRGINIIRKSDGTVTKELRK